MDNLYETIRGGLLFNKFEVRELTFVQYSCPLTEDGMGIWSQYDYLVHVLSGKKTWRTINGRWTVSAGQTLFVKKGATVINQYFDDEFCMLGFFISDDFIRDSIREVAGKIAVRYDGTHSPQSAIAVENDLILSTYFQSMLTYFSGHEKPAESLLELKLKELIINILSGRGNPELASYFLSLAGSERSSLQKIMEENFCYNLSLEEFARLSHMSLSSFKREFTKLYHTSPGKWLLAKRLAYAALLLKQNETNVTQVALECGFEDTSHFSRAFKEKFGVSPLNFRKDGHN